MGVGPRLQLRQYIFLLSDILLSMDPSIQNLKGKILEKPQKHRWSINKGDNKEEWKYTVEHEEEDWTPYNSNLQMQGIKVGHSNIDFIKCKTQHTRFRDTFIVV